MTNDELLKEIASKLDKITKLLAINSLKEYGTEQEKIELLDSMGFSSGEIAKLLNKSVQNVCVQLSLISKKKEKITKINLKNEEDKSTVKTEETK
jgi:hypothetical protein